MSLVPGGQLGAYQIVASLGSGGMGEVYRAHDPRLGRDVALKVLPAEMASDPSRLERFTREARAIAALNHPHIVTIYSTEEAGAIRFLTMELVEGQSLDALIPSGGMTLARFLELAIPLADALNAAHQKQITHRDLKPGNVMVASDGRLKVLDFGLASAPAKVGASIDDDGTGFSPADMVTSPQITTPGMVIGTMPYMSPEQVEGKQLDHRTDLFSLGVMFHEMLVGSRPFTGASPPQLMSSILRDTPSSTSDLRTEVPDTLSRLIVRCLEKHPDDRVQTARDVYNELRHVQRQLESGSVRRVSSAGAAVAPIADSLWIAVLPFTTRGTDPDGESLAAGLTEDITAALARFPSLSVVALQSASSFKGAQLDVRTIAERLRARYIMGGSVRKSASGIRVAAHLTDATSGAQLWTETYDRAGDRLDIYAVQDDVTDRVVSTVADKTGVLARSMVQAVRGIPLDKLSGPELVYRCWGAHLNPSPTEQEELRAALESFLARRPDEPELWAQLSQFYTFEYSLWFNPLDSLVRARRAARRAIELDPSNQEGWVSLALACFHDRDEAGLLEAVDRVLRINPRASNAVAWMGNVLTHTGAYDRGCQITDRAMALNASHAGWYHFAPFNRAFARGDFNEALKSARRVNIAGFHWMHIAIAAAAGHLGLSAEGAAAVEALHMVAPPLADDQNLREMVTRWYWFEEVIESLLEGVRRSKNAASEPEATALPRRPRSSPSAAGPVRQPPSSATVAAGTWVAVIPFMSPSSDEDSRTLADGLTEDITAGLARFPYLSVVAAHSARQHKGTTADVRQIGKALGARYILDGGIRRGGSSIRITARLVDAESGAQLWSETYTREIQQGNLLALQDDVTDRVVATVADVHGVLLRSASGNVRAVPIDQLGLEELRLRYWSYHRQHAPIEHGLLRDHFERLVEAQPAFSPFWAALAHLYLHEYGFGFNARPQPLLRARQAVDRALELDSLNQHAWEALAFTLFFEQDREGFAHAVDRVLALNPRNANAMALMGVLFVHAGELERGSALADRAMVINPDHPGWYHIARGSRDYASGDFEAALRSAKRINMPQHLWAHALVAMSSAQLGRTAETLAALETLLAVEPAFADETVMAAAARRWKWLPEHAQRMVDGYRKAMALRSEAARTRPATDAGISPAAAGVASAGIAAVTVARQGQTKGLRIAVLPFTSRGGDAAATLADGLTDDITAALSRFSYLRVVSRDQVGASAGEGAAAGRQLGARYLLESSVRTFGQSVRVSARLVDVESGAHLWAENFDHDLKAGPFAVQDEVAGKVAARVADPTGVLVRSMVASLKDKPGASLTVFELTLQFFAYLETFTAEQHARLRDALEKTLEHAPNDATGWAVLADLYAQERVLGHNPLPDPVGRQRRAAERALSIDATCQYGWVNLASSHYLSGDIAAFQHEAERAVALNPLNTHVLSHMGSGLALSGSWDRGAALIRQALELNPNLPRHVYVIPFLDAYRRGEDEVALAAAKKISLPGLHNGHFARAVACGQLQRREEALTALDDLRRVKPEMTDPGSARAMLSGWLHDSALVDRLIEGLEKALALTRPPSSSSSRAVPAAMPAALTAAVAPANPAAAGPSIAVLPFVDLSAEKDQGWFCDGIAEEILNALTQLPGLRVAARTSAFSFRGRDDAVKAIGETLGVGSVLEGSVRRAGDRVRVTVQLVEVTNGYELWSDRFDRELEDIFDVQDEIARAVAERLKVSLAARGGARLVAPHAPTVHAYERYLKARALLIRRGPDILPALEQLREVVELAPDFAPAWSAIAEAYSLGAYSGLIPGADARRGGLSAARRAMVLAPESADSYAAIGGLRFLCENDRSGALAAHRRALELNPFHIQNRCWYALFLQRAYGRFDEGVAEARRVLEIDPLSAYVTMVLGTTLLTAGRPEEGAALGRRAVEIDPQSFHARWALGVALTYSGQLEEAGRVLEQAAAMSGRHHFAVTSLAINHARQGRSDRARQLHRELLDRAASGYVPSTQLILTADAMGDREEALRNAERALAEREPPLVMLARHFPDFQDLRQDPRFVAILRAMDEPWPSIESQ